MKIQAARADGFARKPDAPERLAARAYFDRGGTLRHFCLALLNANEFLYVE